jgi:hypothetical protein
MKLATPPLIRLAGTWAAPLAALPCLVVCACATPARTPAAVERAPFTAVWDGETDDASLWTQWLSEDLETHGAVLIDLIPADATTFCKTWPRLTRRGREQVWITLISAIAKHESDFNPHGIFEEPPPTSELSIGLMQLSLSDAKEYHCDFTTEAQIEDPRSNLECAVRILAALVPTDGVVGGDRDDGELGAAGYWSVLNVRDHADARDFIIGQTTALPVCAQGSRRLTETRSGD